MGPVGTVGGLQDELILLKLNKPLQRENKLVQLRLFLDEKGANTVLLPPNNQVTHLLIDTTNKFLLHSGVQNTNTLERILLH